MREGIFECSLFRYAVKLEEKDGILFIPTPTFGSYPAYPCNDSCSKPCRKRHTIYGIPFGVGYLGSLFMHLPSKTYSDITETSKATEKEQRILIEHNLTDYLVPMRVKRVEVKGYVPLATTVWKNLEYISDPFKIYILLRREYGLPPVDYIEQAIFSKYLEGK